MRLGRIAAATFGIAAALAQPPSAAGSPPIVQESSAQGMSPLVAEAYYAAGLGRYFANEFTG